MFADPLEVLVLGVAVFSLVCGVYHLNQGRATTAVFFFPMAATLAVSDYLVRFFSAVVAIALLAIGLYGLFVSWTRWVSAIALTLGAFIMVNFAAYMLTGDPLVYVPVAS